MRKKRLLQASLLCSVVLTGTSQAGLKTRSRSATIKPNKVATMRGYVNSSKYLRPAVDASRNSDYRFEATKTSDGALRRGENADTSAWKSRKFWWTNYAGVQCVNRSTKNSHTNFSMKFKDHTGSISVDFDK